METFKLNKLKKKNLLVEVCPHLLASHTAQECHHWWETQNILFVCLC